MIQITKLIDAEKLRYSVYLRRRYYPKILQQAEVDKGDLFVSLTDSDQVNILSCLMANDVVKGKVARVTDPGFLVDTDQYDLYRMGIDLIINQKQSVLMIFNMLMMQEHTKFLICLMGK